jgi:hypothetical protein
LVELFFRSLANLGTFFSWKILPIDRNHIFQVGTWQKFACKWNAESMQPCTECTNYKSSYEFEHPVGYTKEEAAFLFLLANFYQKANFNENYCSLGHWPKCELFTPLIFHSKTNFCNLIGFPSQWQAIQNSIFLTPLV